MAIGIKSKGINVSAFADVNSKLHKGFVQNDIDVKSISVSAFSSLNLFKLFKLKKQLKKYSPDCIILNLSTDVKIAGLAAKLAGVKNIIYRRGSAIPIKNTITNRILFKYVITHILANSEETKRTILAKNTNLFSSNNIEVIYNGIAFSDYDNNAEPLYKREADEFVFGNLARLSKQKGQFDLITAAQVLKQKGLNFKILIGGDGELYDELKRKVKGEKLEQEILFLGFVDNVSSFYSSIDVFLFPSIWEGFGFSLVEAKLFKKPIVAYNVSSNPEVVKHGNDGILVPLSDKEAFVNAALSFIEDKQKANEYGENGYTDIKNRFLFEDTISNLDRYLKRVVKN